MAWQFGDGFDLYASMADAFPSYWDSGNASGCTMIVGRFAGSQALQITTAAGTVTKSSGVNDAVHHIVVSFKQNTAITGSSLAFYFQLLDATTGQCCVVFRSDGAILLTSGTPGGTVLATYTGAFPVTATWYAFEIEVFISNTAGYMNVRKNGNTVNDFASATNLATRVSANSYANKLTVGNSVGTSQAIDDLYWRSDASSVPWMGDIRCYTRLPASDASVTFAKSPATSTFYFTTSTSGPGSGPAANTIWWYSVQAPFSGSITTLNANFAVAVTGHVNMALYDATGVPYGNSAGGAVPSGGAGPGALLGTATPLTNPALGVQTFTLVTPVTVTRGQYLWLGMIADTTLATAISGSTVQSSASLAFTYASGAFPATAAGFGIVTGHNGFSYLGATMTPSNAGLVNEPQQDATTSYVFDSTPGHADFYGINSIGSASPATIAVVTRAYMQKSDAGARTAAVQLKSGGTTVASPTLTLSSSGWLWTYRIDTVDPATGSAWSPTAVNNLQIGPVTVT